MPLWRRIQPMTTTLLALLVMLVTLAAALGGEQAKPNSTGSISGRVTDADTHAGLAGVRVGSSAAGWVETDSTGRFRLAGLSAGRISISIYNRQPSMSLAPVLTIDLRPGESRTGVDFNVRLEGTLKGTVRDMSGAPMRGAHVLVISREYSRSGPVNGMEVANGHLWYFVAAWTTTLSDGSYSIENVRAGRPYRILAKASATETDVAGNGTATVPTYYGMTLDFESAQAVTVHSLQIREYLDIYLVKERSYCVRGTLDIGSAVPAVEFTVEENELAELQQYAFTSTAPPWRRPSRAVGGRATKCGLSPGPYHLIFGDRLPIENATVIGTADFYVTNEDVDIGTVRAVRRATVTVKATFDTQLQQHGSTDVSVRPWLTAPRSVTRSERNEVIFQLVPNIPYSVLVQRITPPLYVSDVLYNGGTIRSKVLTVEPSSSGVLEIRLSVESGTLIANASRPPPNGNARYFLFLLPDRAMSPAELASSVISTMADETGLSMIAGVPHGDYLMFGMRTPPPVTFALPNGQVHLDKTPEAVAAILLGRSQARAVEVRPAETVRVPVDVNWSN